MTDLASLADRFAAMAIAQWTAKGLPAEPLAQALLAHGLSITTRRDNPATTANALRDLADDIDMAGNNSC